MCCLGLRFAGACQRFASRRTIVYLHPLDVSDVPIWVERSCRDLQEQRANRRSNVAIVAERLLAQHSGSENSTGGSGRRKRRKVCLDVN